MVTSPLRHAPPTGARGAERQTKRTQTCYPPTSCGASQGLVAIVRPTKLELPIDQYPAGSDERTRCALRPFRLGAIIVRSGNCCSWRAPLGPRHFNEEYFVGIVTHFTCFLSPTGGDASRGYDSRRHNAASPELLRDEKGRIQLAPCRFAGAQSWVFSRPHLRLPERRGEKRCSEAPNYRFTYAPQGPRAWRYSEVSLCFLSYTFRRGVKHRMREEHFVREVKAP
jgi:hypothetical protein